MINSIKCPFCNSLRIIKCGKLHKLKQRYLCKECGKKFLTTTNTVMNSHKLSLDFLEQLINLMLNDTKLKTISDFLEISSRTAYLWRMKVYTAVEELQKDILLSNVVWIDEKFIRVNKCKLVIKNNGLNYRGVSRNQVCIACATDIFGNRFAIVAGNGHITSKQCIDTYGKHIEKGTTIIHDGIFSHDKLITYLNAKSIVYKFIGIQAHKSL